MKKKIILIVLTLITPSCFFQQSNITGIVKNDIESNESSKPKNENLSLSNTEKKVNENKKSDDIKTSSSPDSTYSTNPSTNTNTLERSPNYGGGSGSGGGIPKPISTNIIGQIKEDEPLMSTPIPSTANDIPYSSTSGSVISGKVKK